jgi:NitT/TauT family transport system permease protein
VLLACWEALSSNEVVNSFFFPAPSKVFAAAWSMTVAGELPRELAATLGRYFQGVVLGCAAGIACGVLMGVSAFARRSVEPMVAALYSTPKLTLLPLMMLLLGIGDESKIALIALVGFIFLAMQTLDAIRGVERRYVEMARNYRASEWALIRRVYLPAAMPQMFTGLRMAFTRSLVSAIALELVSGTDGLGALIWMSWETLATTRLYVGILTAGALGVVLHHSLASLESAVVPWRR